MQLKLSLSLAHTINPYLNIFTCIYISTHLYLYILNVNINQDFNSDF